MEHIHDPNKLSSEVSLNVYFVTFQERFEKLMLQTFSLCVLSKLSYFSCASRQNKSSFAFQNNRYIMTVQAKTSAP